MLSPEHANSTGNERFTGYIPELMQQLAHVVGFKYRLSLVDDASYGLPQRGGSWNGLIGQQKKIHSLGAQRQERLQL